MKKLVYGYIFARGGSKGVPRKNIRPLAGRPLISYAIEALQKSKYPERVIVSTDDEEIAETARRYGAETPFMRPAELAADNAPELLSWKHALREAEKEGRMPDIMLAAPCTAPLRIPEDLDAAAEMLESTGADYVFSVTPAANNPYFTMATRGAEGRSALLLKLPSPVARRQDAPPVYDITSVGYAARAEFILNCGAPLEGDVRSVVVPAERAVDIDTPLDFEFAEFLMRKRQAEANG